MVELDLQPPSAPRAQAETIKLIVGLSGVTVPILSHLFDINYQSGSKGLTMNNEDIPVT